MPKPSKYRLLHSPTLPLRMLAGSRISLGTDAMAEANSPPRRSRWFQISLRTLLAIVLGFGLGLAVNQRFAKETSDQPDPSNIRRGDRLTVAFNPANFANPAR